jgi:hypothetical protein
MDSNVQTLSVDPDQTLAMTKSHMQISWLLWRRMNLSICAFFKRLYAYLY